jgi:hypothetical protein
MVHIETHKSSSKIHDAMPYDGHVMSSRKTAQQQEWATTPLSLYAGGVLARHGLYRQAAKRKHGRSPRFCRRPWDVARSAAALRCRLNSASTTVSRTAASRENTHAHMPRCSAAAPGTPSCAVSSCGGASDVMHFKPHAEQATSNAQESEMEVKNALTQQCTPQRRIPAAHACC